MFKPFKTIFAALLTTVCLSSNVSADPTPKTSYEDAYIELPTHMRVEQDSEDHVIRYYFDYRCMYCRELHQYMLNWSSTLPSGFKFKFEHVVVNDDHYKVVSAATEYVFNSNVPIENKNRFMDHMFAHIHKTTSVVELTRLVKEALADVDLSPVEFARDVLEGEYIPYWEERSELQRSIHLQVTPTVLVGGRYMTHLGLSEGNTEQFINLLNAVTSMYIYQEK